MNKGKRKKQYDDDFKRHIVELYEAGQSKAWLAKEYSLAPTTVNNWIGFYQNSGSVKAKEDRYTKKSNGDNVEGMKLKAGRGIVTDLKEKYSVTELCEYLGIKRNTY